MEKKKAKEAEAEAEAKAEAKKKAKAEAKRKSKSDDKSLASSPSDRTEVEPGEAGKDEVDIGFGTGDKKRLQSNLAGQVKNAKNKLQQSAMGLVTLTDDQRVDLQQKVKFGADYAEVSDQSKKDEMLMVFKADKSCKTWATYKHEFEKSESTTERRVNGYGTKLLGNIV